MTEHYQHASMASAQTPPYLYTTLFIVNCCQFGYGMDRPQIDRITSDIFLILLHLTNKKNAPISQIFM